MENVTDLNNALKFMANQIWSKGESKGTSCQCLIPFSYEGKKELDPYETASKIIFDKMNATHFDCCWEVRGKSVKLRFYEGDSFGACLNTKLLCEKVIDIEP
jgi:hypothetical protein